MAVRYWMGPTPLRDSFGAKIDGEFIDGRSNRGPWGYFTPENWRLNGAGSLGIGFGQRYVRQDDGRYLKVEG